MQCSVLGRCALLGLKPLPTRSDAVTLTCCLPAATRDASLPHPFPVPTLLPRQASHPSQPTPVECMQCSLSPDDFLAGITSGAVLAQRARGGRFSVSCACPRQACAPAPISSRLTAGDDSQPLSHEGVTADGDGVGVVEEHRADARLGRERPRSALRAPVVRVYVHNGPLGTQYGT